MSIFKTPLDGFGKFLGPRNRFKQCALTFGLHEVFSQPAFNELRDETLGFRRIK